MASVTGTPNGTNTQAEGSAAGTKNAGLQAGAGTQVNAWAANVGTSGPAAASGNTANMRNQPGMTGAAGTGYAVRPASTLHSMCQGPSSLAETHRDVQRKP